MSDAMTDAGRTMPPPLPASASTPTHTDDAGWHWASPEKERAVVLRQAWSLLILYSALFVAIYLGDFVSGEINALVFFACAFCQPFLLFYLVNRNTPHALASKAHLGYRMNSNTLQVFTKEGIKELPLAQVRSTVVWHAPDGTPHGIVLRTGRFQRAHFWGLSDMPGFVAAVLAALPADTPRGWYRLQSSMTYRVRHYLGLAMLALALFALGLLRLEEIGAFLLLVCIGMFVFKMWRFDPRSPNY